MDAILSSHWIDPKSLRENDFEVFMAKRSRALLDLVEGAMGKVIEPPPENTSEVQDNSDDSEELEVE
jgi:hypothetical protein